MYVTKVISWLEMHGESVYILVIGMEKSQFAKVGDIPMMLAEIFA